MSEKERFLKEIQTQFADCPAMSVLTDICKLGADDVFGEDETPTTPQPPLKLPNSQMIRYSNAIMKTGFIPEFELGPPELGIETTHKNIKSKPMNIQTKLENEANSYEQSSPIVAVAVISEPSTFLRASKRCPKCERVAQEQPILFQMVPIITATAAAAAAATTTVTEQSIAPLVTPKQALRPRITPTTPDIPTLMITQTKLPTEVKHSDAMPAINPHIRLTVYQSICGRASTPESEQHTLFSDIVFAHREWLTFRELTTTLLYMQHVCRSTQMQLPHFLQSVDIFLQLLADSSTVMDAESLTAIAFICMRNVKFSDDPSWMPLQFDECDYEHKYKVEDLERLRDKIRAFFKTNPMSNRLRSAWEYARVEYCASWIRSRQGLSISAQLYHPTQNRKLDALEIVATAMQWSVDDEVFLGAVTKLTSLPSAPSDSKCVDSDMVYQSECCDAIRLLMADQATILKAAQDAIQQELIQKLSFSLPRASHLFSDLIAPPATAASANSENSSKCSEILYSRDAFADSTSDVRKRKFKLPLSQMNDNDSNPAPTKKVRHITTPAIAQSAPQKKTQLPQGSPLYHG